MKIALFGSNTDEVQNLNKYFLKYIAPKRKIDRVKISESHIEYIDLENTYIIRVMNLNAKGNKYNKIYYTNTLSEDMISYVYNCLTVAKDKVGDRFIELKIENLNFKVFNIFCPRCGKQTEIMERGDSYGGGGTSVISNCDTCNLYIHYEIREGVDRLTIRRYKN